LTVMPESNSFPMYNISLANVVIACSSSGSYMTATEAASKGD
jgi:hypothetical protein